MSRILHWRFCGTLSVMLAICMILPVMALAGSAVGSAKPVVIANSPGYYKISLGKAEDARVGTKGVISRHDKDIAKFEITSVELGYSCIKLTDVSPNETVLVGDGIQLTTIPATAKIKKASSAGKTLGFLLLVGALAALGSGKGGHGGSGSNAAHTVNVQATRTSMPADGASTTAITATVVDAQNAAVSDGTPVTFSASAGAITPATTTTAGGSATATLTSATTAGPCTVTAHAGEVESTVTVAFVPSDQGNRGSITLEATPASIQVLNSGGAQTESSVVATCRDEMGALATSGTVTFTSTLGSVIGTAEINPATGEATTNFSSSQTGDADITAEWSGASANITVKVTAGPPHSITAQCTPTAIECDGNSFATVKVTVTDIAGNPVTDGTVVDYTVQSDVAGGGNGTVTPQTRTTDGVATALLFSRDSAGAVSLPGTSTVTATVTRAAQLAAGIPAPAVDISNHETQVLFTSLDVEEIHIGANPTNIRGWDFVNATTTIEAVVYDSHHNPVPNGTAVYFSANHGMIYGNGGTAGTVAMSTTTLGHAQATLVSDASGDGTWNGFVDVSATSGNVNITVPGLVIFSGPPVGHNCQINISPTTLVNSGDAATVTIIALDTNGNPVVDGTKVDISATKGSIGTSAVTLSGVVQVTLSTSTDPANPTATGTGTVTAKIDSGGSGLPVTVSTDYTVATPGP
jgi:adhesin/invasin